MAHSAVQTAAGEAKHIILVNLPNFFDQIAMTTLQLNDCITDQPYGTLYTETEDSDNLYVELNKKTVLILQDLQIHLESQLRTALI